MRDDGGVGEVRADEARLNDLSFLGNIGAWPRIPADINPAGWLRNFKGDDREVARSLLRSVIYIGAREFRQALAFGVKRLSAGQIEHGRLAGEVGELWRKWLGRSIVTVPLGSHYDVTSSGVMCLRILKEMGFPEDRLAVGDRMYKVIADQDHPPELVMLDDLAGTGNQFATYWTTEPKINGRTYPAPASLRATGDISSATYVPVVATDSALRKFSDELPDVSVSATHTLGPEYRAQDANSRLVPEDQRAALLELLESNHSRLQSEYGPLGYKRSGLAITFEHGTPNNTLPILAPRTTTKAVSGWTFLRSK